MHALYQLSSTRAKPCSISPSLPSSLNGLAKGHQLVCMPLASPLVGLSAVDLRNYITEALDLQASKFWLHRWQVPGLCGHTSTLSPSFPVLGKPTVATLSSDVGATQCAPLWVSILPCSVHCRGKRATMGSWAPPNPVVLRWLGGPTNTPT